ncbi:MAG TPA: trehalose-phosphatase [Acidimicrobiia bacterium]|nr:trehalose-phosphatase [Acidimicrobiia bacterium]
MTLPIPLEPLADDPRHSVLLVDFDGSLAPIVADPASARPLPAARDALAALVPFLGRVAVVSGRPVAFLVDALGLDGVVYAGLYGLERLVDGEVAVDPRAEPWLDVMAQVAEDADAAFPDLLVEHKGRVAVTIHWRSALSLAAEARAFAAGLARRYDLDPPLLGRMAVELRPPVPVDKGTVTAELARGAAVAVFAGDDAGDLAAFDVLANLAASGAVGHGVRIGVRSDEAPPGIFDADIVVDGPAGLAAVLRDVAEELSARG